MIVALLAGGLAIWVALVVLSVVLVRRAGAYAARLPPEQAIALAELRTRLEKHRTRTPARMARGRGLVTPGLSRRLGAGWSRA
jgi:hypothetical protein